MADEQERERVAAAMRRINDAWLRGRVEDLAASVHPDIVMVFPGFAGRAQGRDGFLAGFRDFCENAIVHGFRQDDEQIDIAGTTAVVSFRYEMLYERAAKRYRVTGRDLWVFEKSGPAWLAVWRAMLDLDENPA
jgi:ketosteroid isomerase-like protein